ncbi:lipocalin family protein [Spirosoma fluminis]
MKAMNFTRLFTWALVVAMPLWFGSCKKDGTDIVTPGGGGSSVEGTWRISGYKVNPGFDDGNGNKVTDLLAYLQNLPGGVGKEAVTCLTTTKITFNSNGKITGVAGTGCDASSDMNPVEDNSNWKLDGNKMTITSGNEVTVYDTAVSGNVLKLSSKQQEDFDGDGTEETYTVTMELTKA